MKLFDLNTERTYSLPELFSDWQLFRKEEPWNHAESFSAELFEILMASVNGRNDCNIIGMTASEIDKYITKLRKRAF